MADTKYTTDYAVEGTASSDDENVVTDENVPQSTVQKITRTSSIITVLVAGLALFSGAQLPKHVEEQSANTSS